MTTSTKGFDPTYQKGGPDWFCRLKGADFDVDDCPREGRSKTFEDGKLEELFDDELYQTQEQLALVLGNSLSDCKGWE